MAAAQEAAQTPGGKVKAYQDNINKLADIRQNLMLNARASGEWTVETIRTTTETQKLTRAIGEGKLGMRQFGKEGRKQMRDMIEEQHRLRNAFAVQTMGQEFGKTNVDMFVPKGVAKEMRSWTTELGSYGAMVQAVGQRTIDWGKNTQWAGRQIMVGLTVPLGIAAMGMAKNAYEIDKQLTRIAKVYDTQSTEGLQGAQKQAAAELELGDLRANSLALATQMAKEYGASMTDVLDVQAQLAATGLNGSDLLGATSEVTRIATLGELDYQDAIDTTISLQTAFRLSNEELTESFNFMNAVENATSLSIQDITEAVPRAASALSTLGGTTQEMTIMLVAMKEAGVDAAEGANAIKSATSRLLNPTPGAVEAFENLGININKTVEDANGNIFEIMTNLAAMTKNVDNLSRQKAIQELFGTYQFNRLTALWQNLGGAIDETGQATNQTGQAMLLAGQDATQWASLADQEIQRYQESISGRFKTAVETFKAELVPLGITILGFITPVVEGLSKIVSVFNDLSDFNKNAVLITLAIAGIVGPVLMLTGIMANLFGQIMRGSGAIATLVARFKPLDAEQTATQLLAKRAAQSWDTQTSSAAILTQSIQTLTNEMQKNAVAAGRMLDANSNLTVPAAPGSRGQMYRDDSGAIQTRVTKTNNDGTTSTSNTNVTNVAQARTLMALEAEAAKNSAAVANNAEKTTNSLAKTAGSLAMFGVAAMSMVSMVDSSDSIGNNLMNAAVFAASMASVLPNMSKASGLAGKIADAIGGRAFAKAGTGIANGVAGGAILANTKGFSGTAGTLTKISGTLGRILPQALRFFGPIGLIAGGIALVTTFVSKLDEIEEAQIEINKSAQAWSDILGYVNEQQSLAMQEAGGGETSYSARAKDVEKLKEANGALVDSLKAAKKEGGDFSRVYQLAMAEALKVVSSGGTVDDAKNAMQIALQAAGLNEYQIDDLMVRFNSVDLTNPEEIRKQLLDQIRSAYSGLRGEAQDPDGFWAGLTEGFGGDLSDKARAAGSQAGQQFADAFQNASTPDEKAGLIMEMQGILDENIAPDFNQLKSEYGTAFNDLGITSIQQLMHAWKTNEDEVRAAFPGMGDRDVKELLDKYQEQLDVFFQGFGDDYGLDEDQIERLQTELSGVGGLMQRLGVQAQQQSSPGGVWAAFEERMSRAGMAGRVYTEQQQLQIVNQMRVAAGLSEVSTLAEAMADATSGAAGGVAELNGELAAGSGFIPDYAGALKNAMSTTWNQAFEEADRLLQENQQAEIDGINEAGERRQKALDQRGKNEDAFYEAREKALNKAQDAENDAFEKHWDDLNKREEAYWDGREDAIDTAIENIEAEADARTEAIEKTMEEEDKADSQRQKIFEAEKTRIQRLAQLRNTNIDFNSALNSGNLDEAAKIFNTSQADTAQWALDDTQTTEEEKRTKRKEEYQAQIESIDNERKARVKALENAKEMIGQERDARIDALKEMEKAAQNELKARQDIAAESLRTERENARDRLANAKETAQEVTRDSVERAQQRHEADRRALDLTLTELRAFIPRNEKELADYMARLNGAYNQYGIDLQGRGNAWGQYIGRALQANVAAAGVSIQNDINWDAIGKQISDRTAAGVGITSGDLQFFLKNGRFPTQGGLFGLSLDKILAASQGINLASNHAGGYISRHAGGMGFSQADRVGVQRSANLMPSEVPSILKRGEFVVNEKATRANRPMLEQINSNKPMDRVPIARHTGGIVEPAGIIGSMVAAASQQALNLAVINQQAAEATISAMAAQSGEYSGPGGGGSNGGYGGTGPTWQFLDNIRKQLFPNSVRTSAVRPGDPGWHGKGMAIDIGVAGNKPSGLIPIAQKIASLYPNSTQLINNPGGSIANGKKVPASYWGAGTWADHADHVHWAMNPAALNSVPKSSGGGGGGLFGLNFASVAAAGGAPGTIAGNKAIVQAQAAQRGWTGAQWNALDKLIMGESGYKNTAQNPTSTAYGMFQFLNSTWAGYGVKKTSDPTQQAIAGLRYIADRYGTPANAYAKWSARSPHWYDNGGYLQPGITQVMNGTGKPEPVFTADQWGIMKGIMNAGASAYSALGNISRSNSNVDLKGGDEYTVNVKIEGPVSSEIDLERAIYAAIDRRESRNGKVRKVTLTK